MTHPELFESDGDAGLPLGTLEDWKQKLVLATNHAERNQQLRKEVAGEIGARAKHFRKLAKVLAECIRDGSDMALYQAFGRKTDQVLAELKPRDLFHDGLTVWLDQEREDARERLDQADAEGDAC